MNKSDLTEAVAASANLNKSSAGKAVEAVFEAIEGAMSRGDSVSLIGFGTFSVSDRAAPLQGEGRRFDPCSTHQFRSGSSVG